jgi:hypothetical protein
MKLTPLRLTAAAVAVAALPLAAGCGSGASESAATSSATQTWADGVCSAISTYSTQLKQAGATLEAGNYSTASLQQAADSVSTATTALRTTMQQLAKPNTVSGASAKSVLATLTTSLQADAQKAKEAVAAQNTGAALATVSATLLTARAQITAAVDDLQQLDVKGELTDAVSQAPSCASL